MTKSLVGFRTIAGPLSTPRPDRSVPKRSFAAKTTTFERVSLEGCSCISYRLAKQGDTRPSKFKICLEQTVAQLGFSDLNEDEALAIGLFRDWSLNCNRQLEFEKEAREILERDPISMILVHIFAVFQEIAVHSFVASGVGDVLSPCEMDVLDLLSIKMESTSSGEYQMKDPKGAASFRRTQEIPRSGLDDLVEAVSRACIRVVSGL